MHCEVTTIELLRPVQFQLNPLPKRNLHFRLQKEPGSCSVNERRTRGDGLVDCMTQHQRMLSDLLIETCDELNRRAETRRACYQGATTSAICDGARNRRSGRELMEGQDEIRLALSDHPDRLRLFPHILWKSCTTFGSLSMVIR